MLLAGLSKVFAPYATAAVLEARGIPDPLVVGVVASVCETCVGTLILLGWFARRVAFAALLFYVPIAILFHHDGSRPLDIAFDVLVIAGLAFTATRRN